MDPSSVKALCFEVFGTVADWRSSIIRAGGQTKDMTAEKDWDVVARDFFDLADQLGC